MSSPGRHLGFDRSGNSAIRSADPENPAPEVARTKHELDRITCCGDILLLLLLCLSTPAGAQAADDTPPLRPILCLAFRFAPAQFHASQLLLNCLFHVFFGLPLSRQP